MKGFLEIEVVANVTGFTVEEIQHFVDEKRIPHNTFADGNVLFSIADIERWKQTHKATKPAKTAPAAAKDWPDEPAAPAPAPQPEKPKTAPKAAATKGPHRASRPPKPKEPKK